MGLLFIKQHDGLCVIPLPAPWWGDSLPSMQQELWLLQWLSCPYHWLHTLPGTYTWWDFSTCSNTQVWLTALLWVGGCQINPSASDSIPAPSATPCSFCRMQRDVCLWRNDRAAQLSSRQREAVFPEVLAMEWNTDCSLSIAYTG